VPSVASGLIGDSYHFDGVNDVVKVPDQDAYSIIVNNPLSVSFWLKLDDLNQVSGGWFSPVGKGDYSVPVPNARHEWKFNIYASDLAAYPTDRYQRRSFYILDKESGQGSGDYAQPGYNYAGEIEPLTTDTWVYLCGQVQNDHVYLYNNGILGHAEVNYILGEGASGNTIQLQNSASAVWLGSTGDNGNWLDGYIDEFRISKTFRSASWLYADYCTQLDKVLSYVVLP
jgi:hypothetical protein